MNPINPAIANKESKKLGLLLVAALVAAILATLLLGCTTTQTVTGGANGGTPTTNLVATLDTNLVIESIEAVVPPLVSYGCAQDKNVGPYLTQVAIVLRLAAGAGTVDAASISNSLAHISVKELRTPDAAMIEQTVLGFYNAFAGKVVAAKLDQVVWLRPVLNALADAIDAGLPALGWNSTPMWYERQKPYQATMAWNRSYPPPR